MTMMNDQEYWTEWAMRYKEQNEAFAAALDKLAWPVGEPAAGSSPGDWAHTTFNYYRQRRLDLIRTALRGGYRHSPPVGLKFFGIKKEEYWTVHALIYG